MYNEDPIPDVTLATGTRAQKELLLDDNDREKCEMRSNATLRSATHFTTVASKSCDSRNIEAVWIESR